MKYGKSTRKGDSEYICLALDISHLLRKPHVIQRIWEEGLSVDQVLDAILTGTVRKREKDDYSKGKFTKYTIVKRRITVVVKDCKPAFIITARRRR